MKAGTMPAVPIRPGGHPRRAQSGARRLCVINSIVETCKLQGQDPLSLTVTNRGDLWFFTEVCS
jgi:hypothetical protein